MTKKTKGKKRNFNKRGKMKQNKENDKKLCKFWSPFTHRCLLRAYWGYTKCEGNINKCKGGMKMVVKFKIMQNENGSYRIIENPGTDDELIRSPYKSREEALKKEKERAKIREYEIEEV